MVTVTGDHAEARASCEASVSSLRGRSVLAVDYWDIHSFGEGPAQWDYGDWHHAVMGVHGDIVIPEDRLRAAMIDAEHGDMTLPHALDQLQGQAWDDELETFRYAGDGAPVRWLHQVI